MDKKYRRYRSVSSKAGLIFYILQYLAGMRSELATAARAGAAEYGIRYGYNIGIM